MQSMLKLDVLGASLSVRDPITGLVYELVIDHFDQARSVVELSQKFLYPDMISDSPLEWRVPTVEARILLQGVITRNKSDGILFVLKKEDPDFVSEKEDQDVQ